jgi:hypothetical protein
MRSTSWSSRLGGLLFAGSLCAASGALALPLTTFDATDGNMSVEGSETDWATPPPNLTADADRPTGNTDDSFGQGAKEDKPVPSVVSGSIPNNKSDLTNFYFASEQIQGHTFIYLAWTRANTLGNANMDFEFNQSSALSSNNTTPVRTPGDILVTFDFVNGGSRPDLGLLTWITSANGSKADCFAANALPCWGKRVDLGNAGFAEGSVNTSPITDLISGGTLPVLTFGEVAIDLTAAGVVGLNACNPFASAFLKSRSSASFPAELKDFIAPIEVNINTCFKVITIVCKEAGNTLHPSSITLFDNGTLTAPGSTKTSLSSAQLPSGITEQDICGLGGATYGTLQPGTKSETIQINP